MDIQKEREAFQDFCEQNFDFERHEQTYFDDQTQCYENDIGEDTESINMAWQAWQAAKAQAVPEGFVLVSKVFPEEKALNLAKQKIEEASKRNSEKYRIGEFSEDSKAFIIRNELGAMKNLHRDFSRMAEELEQMR